jgi:sortase A
MGTWRPITLIPIDERGPLPPHASPPPRRGLRLLERLLLVVGVLCLGYFGYVSAETALYQAFETRELDAILAAAPPAPAVGAAAGTRSGAAVSETEVVLPTARRPRPADGTALGRLEIPRLNVSAIVRAGSDSRTLRLAVGHIGGTSLPGEPGNIGLAAHRDTFFRRLGEIREHDVVRFVTRDGTFVYRVEGTQVVDPDDTWVLNPTEEPALTLVTCYPFRYVGSAPRRFIVRAHLAEG